MTLILKLDLDMVELYLYTKNEVSMSRDSNIIAWTDKNTERQTHTDRQTWPKNYLSAYAFGNKNANSVNFVLVVPLEMKQTNEFCNFET